MSTISSERDAIVAILAAAYPTTNVYKRWPNNVETPALLLRPRARRLDTQDGGITRTWEIEIVINGGDNEEAQIELDTYLEETGLAAVLEADPTLGGAVENSYFEGWHGYGGRKTEVQVFMGAVATFVIYS